MINIAAVSYLNTLPFVYGINHSGFLSRARLKLMVPSACADNLLEGHSDIALVPVGALTQFSSYRLVSNYCLGAVGNVKTVLLLSEVPVNEIKRIFLDLDSRTSVRLAAVLARHHWKINPEWLPLNDQSAITQKTDAIVAIGDKTFSLRQRFSHITDLAAEWQTMTGLPFVFAVWISTKKIPDPLISEFNEALGYGVDRIEEAVDEAGPLVVSREEAIRYLKHDIHYPLDDPKKEAMKMFLEYCNL